MKPRLSHLVFAVLILAASFSEAAPFTDDAGQHHDYQSPPSRVVSILPSATEIICALDAAQSLAGVTYHDTHLPGVAGLPLVGGAFTPNYELINDLSPDLLIVAPRDFEAAKAERGQMTYPIVVFDDGVSLSESEVRIGWLGEIFGRPDEARRTIDQKRELMTTIGRKVDKIPIGQRHKTIRLMYSDGRLLAPGRDSFQNEMIRAAGGIPPDFGPGAFVAVTPQKWREFQPEVVFDCGLDHQALREFLAGSDWAEVPAVRNGRLYNFPCALTCRAAANTGYFTAWLASTIYADEFADSGRLVLPQEVVAERVLPLEFDYVARARVVDFRLMDFTHRSLLIDFKRPQTIVSTDRGQRNNIMTVGNTYSPTPTWSLYHKWGFEKSQEDLFGVLNIKPEEAELMLTGADMNNLVIRRAAFKDLAVTALVTAGVEGNALRTSKDIGAWYEPGTINIIVLTNHRLTSGAATRALVTVTEAKTAALWDMDIRSVQTPLENPATGTGTDSVIIVAGEGPEITGTGGHTRMGQLIAETVYDAVQEAILKQNGKGRQRHVFERLAERGLTPHKLFGGPDCPCLEDSRSFQADLEELFLTPRYQGFLEAAFSLSDAVNLGQISNLAAFETWALAVATEIAGRPVAALDDVVGRDLPPALQTAINALGTGLRQREAARLPQVVNE